MRKVGFLAMLVLALAAMVSAKPALDNEEFVGPFPNWTNVKTDCGAVGDGKADDTAALEKGFTTCFAKSHVLYLPAGTYRLTKTLQLNACGNFHLIGEDPAKTIIKWDGPEGDQTAMLSMNGVYYAKFSRITWDGSGKNVTAVYHQWGQDLGGVGTGNEHSDEVFTDLAIGVRAGKPNVHLMDAETTVVRCKFLRNSVAGVRIQSFNALDWFIWDSEFDDCAVGITNDPGAGHFHAYRNVFRRSKIADIALRNASYFGIRHNLSLNSKRFFEGRNIGGWAVNVTLQGNTVIDPIDPVAFDIRNVGPIVMFDNVVRSCAVVKEGPVVVMDGGHESSYVAIGNTFTVSKPISARDRIIEEQTKVVAAKDIVTPQLPGAVTPPHKARKVFEVAPGATANAIQAFVTQAMAFKGKRPIIHFPVAAYTVEKTITVPAGADIQFVGDVGFEAIRLNWTGPADGVMFKLKGPTHVTFRDISFAGQGGKGTGILVTNADQPGARIFGDSVMMQINTTGVLVDGLAQTDISFRTFYHEGNQLSIKVVGSPKATIGKPVSSRTCLFGGASSNNIYSYDVANGGRLLVTDTWYEGWAPTFLKMTGSGIFTMNGAQIAPGRPGPNAAPTDPKFAGVALENFRGRASFLNVCFGTRIVVGGDGDGTNFLLLGAHLLGNTDTPFPAPPEKAKVAMLQAERYNKPNEPPCCTAPNIGKPDAAWLLQMLEQVRSDTPRLLTKIPQKATDLRFYRTLVSGFATGLQFEP